MFISTVIVRPLVNHLYRKGKLDEQQRDHLILQDFHTNLVITIGAAVVLVAYLVY